MSGDGVLLPVKCCKRSLLSTTLIFQKRTFGRRADRMQRLCWEVLFMKVGRKRASRGLSVQKGYVHRESLSTESRSPHLSQAHRLAGGKTAPNWTAVEAVAQRQTQRGPIPNVDHGKKANSASPPVHAEIGRAYAASTGSTEQDPCKHLWLRRAASVECLSSYTHSNIGQTPPERMRPPSQLRYVCFGSGGQIWSPENFQSLVSNPYLAWIAYGAFSPLAAMKQDTVKFDDLGFTDTCSWVPCEPSLGCSKTMHIREKCNTV
jgi:hypothetical protein